MVTATYELIPDDIGALASYQASSDYGYRYAIRWQCISMAAIVVLIGGVVAALQSTLREALVPLGISVLVAAYFVVTRYREYPRRFGSYAASRYRGEDSSASLGSQRISIDGSGVSIESDHFSSRMDWDMIRKVDCTKDHIFAFTGPLNAIIVPRRSLQGASFEQVLGALVRRGAT